MVDPPTSSMVVMDAASDHRHHHHPNTVTSPPLPSPSPSPSPPSSSRTRLHNFSFPTLSWGTHRILRCSKNPASSPPPSPPSHPQTPSPEKEKPSRAPAAASPQRLPPRPWNLRTRRSATAAPALKRSDDAAAAAAAPTPPPPTEAKKRGFSVALSKEEIAEDFAAIRGTRPPRRPKKRLRAVQRQLDTLFPGLWLSDVTPDTYKIEER